MVTRMFDCIAKQAKDVFRNEGISLFTNVEAYVEAYAGFSDLVLDNFRFVFLYYFLFGLQIFAVAFVHQCLVMFSKTMTRKRNRRLKYFRNRIKKAAERNTTDCYKPPAINFTVYRTNHIDLWPKTSSAVWLGKCFKTKKIKLLISKKLSLTTVHQSPLSTRAR